MCYVLFVDCWLFVVNCLMSIGCWLLVGGCWLLAIGCWLMVVDCYIGMDVYAQAATQVKLYACCNLEQGDTSAFWGQ